MGMTDAGCTYRQRGGCSGPRVMTSRGGRRGTRLVMQQRRRGAEVDASSVEIQACRRGRRHRRCVVAEPAGRW